MVDEKGKEKNQNNLNTLEKTDEATLIWDEYKYRHDLIWKHLIRSTITVIVLITIPYSNQFNDVTIFTIFAPVLAIGYTLFTYNILKRELELYENVKDFHRNRQNVLFNLHKQTENTYLAQKTSDDFSKRVRFYIKCLIVLACLGGVIHFIQAFCKC
ncbi:MAG: hypothetical protein D8M57_19855 [Candidatus Scalindua sp. AMX11]|nr:hypothetical protein [Planctomycetota bacterium]RZV60802.1 MAG: hypothetical protein EX341_19120 [Candidatus Scalindua sp. SCAELEC01]TDE63140.1 MAG: hypothetical protein D8M57_19855 [Candidatus Scalindua sp. AMX11]GJQ57588.1 MAG: hypothetical protein SCALA701_03890 [Candidatus Scalindua sp.]